MKQFFLFSLLIFISCFSLNAQIVKGSVIDSKTGNPLAYASIGILKTPYGTVADEKGRFAFESNGQEASSIVRVSMIGYKPQQYILNELLQNEETMIRLQKTMYEIPEVKVHPKKEHKIGATRHHISAGWSGWGGFVYKRGYEMGIKLSPGSEPVKIKKLHIKYHRQSFDTSFYRLHIRAIEDTIIGKELLTENIILPVSVESGWAEIDLENYNIFVRGDVGLTLEWLKVSGNNEDRAMKVNQRLQKAYILFKNNKKHHGLYRWGTEAKWNYNRENAPCIYVTVLK